MERGIAVATEHGNIENDLDRAGSYKNSINAIEGMWSGSHPLRPLMSMLAYIGYVLCDVLEALDKRATKEE